MRAACTALVLAAALFACGDGQPPELPDAAAASPTPTVADAAPTRFASAPARIETADSAIAIQVDIAEREDQRAFGLMDRDSLAPDAGMIFLYETPQPGESGFWMYRTRIPLDIAFFDSSGRIVSILQMQPCTSAVQSVCAEAARNYRPNVPYFGALEMNLGFFDRHGVTSGDRIVLPGRIGG